MEFLIDLVSQLFYSVSLLIHLFYSTFYSIFYFRFVEFLIDLVSQLPTRRFTHAILEDRALLVKCRMAPLFAHPRGRIFFNFCCCYI